MGNDGRLKRRLERSGDALLPRPLFGRFAMGNDGRLKRRLERSGDASLPRPLFCGRFAMGRLKRWLERSGDASLPDRFFGRFAMRTMGLPPQTLPEGPVPQTPFFASRRF